MIRRKIILAPEATDNLSNLAVWISEAASQGVARNYVARVKAYLTGFDLASERGALRNDLRPGLRTVGFERRLTIAFTTTEPEVRMLRVFRAGRDWTSAF